MNAAQFATVLRRMGETALDRMLGRLPAPRFRVQDAESLRQSLVAGIAALPDGVVESVTQLRLDCATPPWSETEIILQEGDWLSWFAAGQTVVSSALDIRVGADFQLWGRIGDGEVFRGTRPHHSVCARCSGRLYLASYFPGEWASRDGELATAPQEYGKVGGTLDVVLVHWRADALEALRQLADVADFGGMVSAEAARLAEPPRPPEPWRYLWFLGPGEIYRRDSQSHCIRCATRADVGILQRDVDLPLTASTRLEWRWRIECLPSRLREDTLPTHDYLSIAVEFDNGIDITYYWSACLRPGYGYWCPLPTWKDREFHVVQRSGTRGFGEWVPESRTLAQDYRRYIGEPPARIRRVWLIANSIFQRLEGRCDYADIRICDGGSSTALD